MSRKTVLVLSLAALTVLLGIALLKSRAPAPPRVDTAATGSVETQQPAVSSTLNLRVSAGRGNVPSARVALTLADHPVASSTTDEAGAARLGPLPPGRYSLLVAHPEHVLHRQTVEVLPGENQLAVSIAQAATLRVTVIDEQDKRVPAAMVRVLETGSTKELGHCVTSADGNCDVGGLDLGSYRIYVHTGRYRPRYSETGVLAHRGDVVEQVVRLEAGRFISGRVLDPTGSPVVGAHVGSSDEGAALAETDAEGRFELGGMGAEPVTVFATAPGYAPKQMRGVRPGAAGFDISLEAPASVTGRVRGGPAPSLSVSVCHLDSYLDEEICLARRMLDPPDSEFSIDGLPSGGFDVVFEAAGYAEERVRVTLRPGATTTIPPVELRASD